MTSPKKRIETPLTDTVIHTLRTGDSVLITGIMYTARDAAHKRMVESIQRNEALPFPLQDQILFYAGPAPAPPGKVIGSVGPTTACRMDAYTIPLLEKGLKGMIGKGGRSRIVREAIRSHAAVYFAAVGGAAALLARCVISSEIVAYDDLGPEAIRRITVKDFPVIVINDCFGGDLYEEGVAEYRKN